MTSAPFMTPGAGPVRARVEKVSSTFIVWLSRLPRVVPPVIVGVLFFGGVLISGVIGFVMVLLIVALLSLLTFLSWPSVPTGARVLRVTVLVAITIFAVTRLF